jgi:ribosomal protein L27
VGVGKDYTLFAKVDGRVKFATRNKRREIHVVAQV